MNPLLKTKIWKKERLDKIEKELGNNKYKSFIDDFYIEGLVAKVKPLDNSYVDELIEKAKSLKGLTPEEVSYLMNQTDADVWAKLYDAARAVKNKVYGNRIVLFAPVYLSNHCVNNCVYCGFRDGNVESHRRQLNIDEVRKETRALTKEGHKRLLLVYGEHESSDVDYMVETVKTIYAEKNGHDEIRRVNINAAPLFVDEYKKIHESGIGTFQIFQETYKRKMYERMHPKGSLKHIYDWRVFAQHRAEEAGIDDVAIGALFGLYDWKYEVLSLLYHTMALEKDFGVGAHTISFPRLEKAINTPFVDTAKYKVSDEDMKKIITLLRLSVPYTGLILTCREKPELRKELIKLGVSQTDAGSNITIGGYHDANKGNILEKQQFELADTRNLESYLEELTDEGYIPSFCTAGYRCGRTGCEFMEFARSGKVKKFCVPNAIFTYKEYLEDYASPKLKIKGDNLISEYIEKIKETHSNGAAGKVIEFVRRIENGERDLYF